MTVRIKLVISVFALVLGLVVAQFSSPVAKADIAPCAGCGAAVRVDDSHAGGGVGVDYIFVTP